MSMPFAEQDRAARTLPGDADRGMCPSLGTIGRAGGVEDAATRYRPTIGCVVPACDEQASIADVITALLGQTRIPDVIHIVVNNTTDETMRVASAFAGPHHVVTDLGEQFTELFVHDIGTNPAKKVGALNYGYTLVEACDYLLGVDGDTIADPRAVQLLEAETLSESRIGGLSAIAAVPASPLRGLIPRFLVAGQRAQFAACNLQNLLHGRNMAVLGSQFTLFSTAALRTVMAATHQRTPWVRDSDVEASLLSMQLKRAGYLTKISSSARAEVAGMTTLRGYDAQQVRRTHGAIDLMWPGRRGDTPGRPFDPSVRPRWGEASRMLLGLLVRVGFLALALASLSTGTLAFSAWWLAPVLVAALLNLRIALAMKDRRAGDVLFASLIVPAEIFAWVRLGHFARSWSLFLAHRRVDGWSMQIMAEKGRSRGHWMPLIGVIALAAVLVTVWSMLTATARIAVLRVGWPVVVTIAVVLTAHTFFKLVRRHQGYLV
jgi:cellulose synthase/poly-beta-1,6-N-acetylglucosamine synthase-like glycosyltransferase